MQPLLITVVSGLPRSGTSMMMRMLEKGGIPVLSDNTRTPDSDNPGGYYEYEPVKKTATDASWVACARGKCVKVIFRLIEFLPENFEYRIIMMDRCMEEVLASQKKMLTRRGETGADLTDARLAVAFQKKINDLSGWIDQQPNMMRMNVSYNGILEDPMPCCHKINAFLDNILDVNAMSEIIDPMLYRNRGKSG